MEIILIGIVVLLFLLAGVFTLWCCNQVEQETSGEAMQGKEVNES